MALRLQSTLIRSNLLPRLMSSTSGSYSSPTSQTQQSPPQPEGIKDVPGLSTKCIRPESNAVGPGAKFDGEYKVPEYFCFNKMSYYEAEVEMAEFRCPQPKAK